MNVDVQFKDGSAMNVSSSMLYNASLKNGNTVIVGRSDTGKTAYVIKSLRHGYFPGIKEIYYIAPKITLTYNRTQELYKLFYGYDFFIYDASDKESLNNALNEINDYVSAKINNEQMNDNIKPGENEGEDLEITRLMLLDDMSSIADKSNAFGNFITRSRKLQFNVVSIFHDISTSTGIWNIINSNTTRFIFFPVGNPKNISIFLHKFVVNDEPSDKNTSKQNNWIFRLFNDEVKSAGDHLMIDIGVVDKKLNDNSKLCVIRTNTLGIFSAEKEKHIYNKQYIHRNNRHGTYRSYTCEEVKILDKDFKRHNVKRDSNIFCVKELISFTKGGQTLRSTKIDNLINVKPSIEEIDNITRKTEDNTVDNTKKRKLNNTDLETSKVLEEKEKFNNIPLYLQSRWQHNKKFKK